MRDRWATFDCYGTLIDWERGIAQAFAQLWPDADPQTLLTRYHEIEPRIQEGSGIAYRDVLRAALLAIADAEGLGAPADEHALAASLPTWPPFREVRPALVDAGERGWRLAILSNTDPELLAASIERIGVDFDVTVTVAEAGSYKPAPGHWEHFFESTGANRRLHVHVGASLFHDIEPATRMGLRAIWINRKVESRGDIVPDTELTDLSGLPDALDSIVPQLR